jgi:hypothetical protein
MTVWPVSPCAYVTYDALRRAPGAITFSMATKTFLFVPLRTQWFRAFEQGTKRVEYGMPLMWGRIL